VKQEETKLVLLLCEIWGSHGDEDVDVVLGCDAMQTHGYTPTFWKNILTPSSGLKSATWGHNPGEQHHNLVTVLGCKAGNNISYKPQW